MIDLEDQFVRQLTPSVVEQEVAIVQGQAPLLALLRGGEHGAYHVVILCVGIALGVIEGERDRAGETEVADQDDGVTLSVLQFGAEERGLKREGVDLKRIAESGFAALAGIVPGFHIAPTETLDDEFVAAMRDF